MRLPRLLAHGHTDPMAGTGGSRRFRARPDAMLKVARGTFDHPSNTHRRLRALAHLLACEARARATGRPVVTRLGERSLIRAHLHAGGSWRVVRANPPDWAEMTVWRNHLGDGDLFVDVGAHAGVYTIWALEQGAEVIAVEPNPDMAAQLRSNLSLNSYTAAVHEMALAGEPGRMLMSGADLLRQHLLVEPGGAVSAGGVEVEVGTLDDLVGDRVVKGVKIDVEGAERLVLEGASRALADGRIELLQLEWNDCSQSLLGQDRAPVAEILRSHGYELFRPDGSASLVPLADEGFGADVFALRP